MREAPAVDDVRFRVVAHASSAVSVGTESRHADLRGLHRDGTLIGRILLPERCANVCFGGTKRNRLFMAASQSMYSVYVETQGVLGG